MTAAFLRDLAEILHYVPVVHGVDQGHIEALNEAADEFEKLEQQLRERDTEQLALIVDRDRLIYHVLRLLEQTGVPTTRTAAAGACLIDLGHAVNGDRARRMLELGEPGRRAAVQSGPSEPLSDLEKLISDELRRRLSRHVGKPLTPQRIEALKAEAMVCVSEIAEQHAVVTVPPFELEQDPDDRSRVVVVWKERF